MFLCQKAVIFCPRSLRFQIKQDRPKGRSRGPCSVRERHYRPGDTVRQSEIYKVLHDAEHRAFHEVVMISGDHFPTCKTCRDRVRFKLVRAATYIFDDQDFETGGD